MKWEMMCEQEAQPETKSPRNRRFNSISNVGGGKSNRPPNPQHTEKLNPEAPKNSPAPSPLLP